MKFIRAGLGAVLVVFALVFGAYLWLPFFDESGESGLIDVKGNLFKNRREIVPDRVGNLILSGKNIYLPDDALARITDSRSEAKKSTFSYKQDQYNRLVGMAPREIYAGWNDAIIQVNPGAISQMVPALGLALRRTGDKAIYREIGDRLLNRSSTLVDRLALADALMYAATPEAIDQIARLLHASEAWTSTPSLADSPENEVLKQSLNTITRSSRTFMEGSRNWALSPALESLWSKTTDATAPQVLDTIATALAYVGKPDGISTLIQSAAQADTAAVRYRVATNVLEHMEFSDGVDVVGAALQQYASNKDLSRSLVRGLISIGSPDSVLEVTRYLDLQSDLDSNWLSEVNARLAQRQLSSDAAKVLAAWKKSH